jgi:plasmid maintenance system antidote protein VapI
MPTCTAPFRGSVLLRNALARPTEPLNQAAIALQLGVASSAVSNWVTGRARPSRAAIIELEWLFGIEPKDWLTPHERALDAHAELKEVA